MKKNGMRVTSLFLAAVMLASAPVTASAADTSANVEGEVVVDQTSQDQTSAESQNQAGQDQTSAEAQDQSQASAAENAATGANSDNVTIQADDKPYLALGADLTDAQKNTVLSLMGIDPANLGNYDVVYTTNAEEHQYLDSYISSSQIGSKSWSSVVIVKRDKGNGLNISTRNINYCTVGMYKNALTTAGITDADIIVAGPQEISGTAALVGVFKAYQEMTGETINADIIDASLNELVVTGQLEQSIAGLSDEEVEEFIAYIKSVIAQNDLKDEASINQAIDDACSKYNVTLSDSERQQIVDLLLKITSLGINLDSLVDYAESLYHSFKDGGGDSSVLSSVGTFFSNVFSSIADFFKGGEEGIYGRQKETAGLRERNPESRHCIKARQSIERIHGGDSGSGCGNLRRYDRGSRFLRG